MNHHCLSYFAVFSCLFISVLSSQGPLDPPPGPPEPSMKSLQQVEPRTDLMTVPGVDLAMHTITEPGSYFLSSNLVVTSTDGIDIQTSGVTLDLMGFTILRDGAEPAAGSAIVIGDESLRNISIANGHITSGVVYDFEAAGDQFTGAGFENGVVALASGGAEPKNVRVSNLSVSGCDRDGINVGPSVANRVEHCQVETAGVTGITAGDVHHSSAIDCGENGIVAQGDVSYSRGRSVAAGTGILAMGSVAHSEGYSEASVGIDAGEAVYHSVGVTRGNATDSVGIKAIGDVNDCHGSAQGLLGDGIFTFSNIRNSFGGSAYGRALAAPSGLISYSRAATDIFIGIGTAFECKSAIGCISSGGRETITNKYLMP